VFFLEPIPASVARYFGREILRRTNLTRVELFPKQDYTTEYGNLIKLPLGKHKLGERMEFVDGDNPNKVLDGKIFEIEPFQVTEELIKGVQKTLESKNEKTWDECGVLHPRYRGSDPPCIGWLLNGVGGPEAPDRTIPRHDAATAIAGYKINFKVEDPENVDRDLHEWNKLNRPPIPEERAQEEFRQIIKDCLEKGYNYGCKSLPYSYGCDEQKCPFKHPELAEIEKEEFSAEIMAEAETLLSQPDITLFVSAAMGEIVGEERTKVFMWFLQLAKQSMDLSGDSSTGKNATVDGMLRCHPLHSWWKITGSTDKSLRYLPTTIGTLYAAERRALTGKEGEETTTQFDMKLVISEGKLVIIVVEKLPSGKLETKKYETGIENIITTGTDIEIPEELENRLWEMVTDPSLEQNVAVRDRKIEEMSKPRPKRVNTEEKKKVLRCAVEKIEEEGPDYWVNPFGAELKKLLNPNKPRVRRDTDKLLLAIEAFAKAHYRNRPLLRDEQGVLFGVCHPIDFFWAWEYGQAAILGTFTSETQRFREWLQAAYRILDAKKQLTSQTLMWIIGSEETTARSWLNKFAREGYLIRDRVSDAGSGSWHYEYSRAPINSAEDRVEIDFDKLMKAFDDWFIRWGYKQPLNTEHIQELSKQVSGKKLSVRVQRVVSAQIKDLPDHIELEESSAFWGEQKAK
jgi:predicted transcriptional regulator